MKLRTEIEIDLRDVETKELIKALADNGCPNDLIDQLEKWERTPILGIFHLEKWKEMANTP